MATPTVLGYHPLLATRAETGEVLHARLRKGSSQRGAKRFVEELIARVRRAGATGELTVRADSGFWSYTLIDTLRRARGRMVDHGHDQRPIRAASRRSTSRLADDHLPRRRRGPGGRDHYVTAGTSAWSDRCASSCAAPGSPVRAQQALWPDWRHHAFVTDLELTPSRWTTSTATTPESSSPSATSRKARASSTAPRASSSPTRRGSAAPCWPTTSSAGPPVSATSIPAISSPWRAQCAPGSSRCPVASSIAAAPSSCASPCTGHGPDFTRGTRPHPCFAARHLKPTPRTGAAADADHALTT